MFYLIFMVLTTISITIITFSILISIAVMENANDARRLWFYYIDVSSRRVEGILIRITERERESAILFC